MIRRAYTAAYAWLAVPIYVRGMEFCGTDFFGLGALLGALVALALFG